MKLNHKFRLVPLAEDESAVQKLEADMKSLLTNKSIPDYKKMAVYEGLLRQLQEYKQRLGSAAVEIQSTKSDIIPPYALPEHETRLWTDLPQMRSTSSGEIVLDGHVLQGSSFADNLDHAYGKRFDEPYGYKELVEYVAARGVSSPFKKKQPPGVSRIPRLKIVKNVEQPVVQKTLSQPSTQPTTVSFRPHKQLARPVIPPPVPTVPRVSLKKAPCPRLRPVLSHERNTRGFGKFMCIRKWK